MTRRRIVALTPEQKEMKREYLLEQAVGADRIPTFDEVWEVSLSDTSTWILYESKARHYIEHLRNPVCDKLYNDEGEPACEEALEDVRDHIEELYDRVVRRLKTVKECWREITLPGSMDPRDLKRLGIYWSYEEEAAEAHWAGSGHFYTFHAKADPRYINKRSTVLANCDVDLGPAEAEVTFHKGAPIYVYNVRYYDRVLPSEDWRRT